MFDNLKELCLLNGTSGNEDAVREYIINELGIKKAAFYSRIKDYCLYIDYAKHAPKYYLPELEYLKQVSKSIRIYKKVKYNKNK